MSNVQFKEILPRTGMLYEEDMPSAVLCKPKLMPLKSVTLEKLEKMQRDAEDLMRQQEQQQPLGESEDISKMTEDVGQGKGEVNRLIL